MFSSVTPFQAPSASSQASTTSPEETERALKESEMRQAAQDFEASFIAQMLTFSGLGEALTAGGGEEVSAFTSFYIDSFAEQIAEKGGFGLADNFYDQMLKKSGLSKIDNNELVNGEADNVDFGKL